MISTDNTTNYAIGAGAGLLAGGGAGLAVGTKKAGAILEHAKIAKGMTKDAFVKSKVDYLYGTKSFLKANSDGQLKAIENVTEKSGKFFDTVKNSAKNTKIKWAAGLAAAGIAIGAGIAAIANKVKADKEGFIVE